MQKSKLLKLAAAPAALLASVSAFATDPTTAQEAFASAAAASSGFGVPMWMLAAATVGILIGVKWIKRGRGAA